MDPRRKTTTKQKTDGLQDSVWSSMLWIITPTENGKLMMNSNGKPNFDAIMAVLPSMMKGYAKGKGVPVGMPALPTAPKSNRKSQMKRCLIDHKYFGGFIFSGAPIEDVKDGVCPACKKQLKAGWTAFIAPDGRSLMARPKSGVKPEFIGKIIKISVEAMDALWKQAKGEL